MAEPIVIERGKTYVIEVDTHLTLEQMKEVERNWFNSTESGCVILQGARVGRVATKDEEAIDRVYELHAPIASETGSKICFNCLKIYPCDTVKILDGRVNGWVNG